MSSEIVREKLDQAVGLLNEQNLDAWITFVRETSLTLDPCLDLVAGVDQRRQRAGGAAVQRSRRAARS